MAKKIRLAILIAVFATPMVSLAADAPATGPQAFLTESVYEFSPVVEGNLVLHDFVLHNRIVKMSSG